MQCFAHHGLFLLHRQAYCTCSYVCTYICTVCMYIQVCFLSAVSLCMWVCVRTYVHTYSMHLFLLPSLPPLCTATHANPSSPALWCRLSYGTLEQHSLQCLWGHHQTVEHGQFQNKAGTHTHIFIAYTSYSASEFVRDMLYIQYICTYVRTHVHMYLHV